MELILSNLFERYRNASLILSLSLFSFACGYILPKEPEYQYLTPAERVVIQRIHDHEEKPQQEFSEKRLIKFLKHHNVKYIDVIVAQARHETEMYTSPIFKYNHNIFGMKRPEYRSTMAIGTRRGHARYDNWENSVLDYCLMYNTRMREVQNGKNAYLNWIFNNYAEDKNYQRKVMKIVNNKDFQNYIRKETKG